MKRFCTIWILLLLANVGFAQSTDITTLFMSNSRKAEVYYTKFAFKNAIELYERVLDKNPNDLRARTRIAECYLNLNRPERAVIWYRPIIDEHSLDPIHKYNFAQALATLGNYDEARIWYQNYELDSPKDPRPGYKLKFLDNIDYYLRDSALYELNNLSINSLNSEFGAVDLGDRLAFLSSRDEDLFIKYEDEDDNENFGQAPFDIFVTNASDSAFTEPEKLHRAINTKFHEGPLAFFKDHAKVIFTRSNYFGRKTTHNQEGKITLQLFIAEQDAKGEWSNVREFQHNSNEYSTAHPTLSEDNLTLYFTSDMPGGFGGSDIYYSKWINNAWSSPINIGLPINTPGDEVFPFISEDGQLFFSSDGHGGLGGLDVYKANPHKGEFRSLENLGFPINTPRDDFSFSIDADGRNGYVSSNRPGGKGSDDIYGFRIKYKTIVGVVKESRTKENVGNARVSVYDSLSNSIRQVTSNDEGYFYIDLPLDSYLRMDATKDGFGSEESTRLPTFVNSFQTDTIPVLLWRHELFAKGRVFSNETQQLLEGTLVTLENLTDNTFTDLKTGTDGTYWFVLQPNRLYVIQAEKEDHVVSNFRLNTEGMIADTLLNDFVLEETYVNKEVVFFDFNESAIKPDAIPSLNLMVTNLRRHKNTHIVISAHADAQGTFEYNLNLSNRRALAVVAYLRQRGVSQDRITWRGFGEQLLINRCSDGVECPDEEHSKNRRAELKIEEVKSEAPLEPDKK